MDRTFCMYSRACVLVCMRLKKFQFGKFVPHHHATVSFAVFDVWINEGAMRVRGGNAEGGRWCLPLFCVSRGSAVLCM
jgi:hypothetical protein